MKKVIYTLFTLLLLSSISLNAQGSSYKLKMGGITIPLKLVSGPNNYNGRVEVYKEEAIAALKEPVVLVHNNVPIYGSKIIFYFLPNKRDPSSNLTSYTLDLAKGSKLPDDIVKSITEKIEIGDNLTIQSVGAEDGAISLNSAAIAIKDPNQPYKPPVYPQFNNESEIFSFQIVGGLPKSLVKVDTTVATNKKIVQIYSDKKKYDLMHIPGFKTKNRFIKITDTFWPEDEISKTISFSKAKVKPYYLYPEVAIESEYSTSMRWGNMVAAPLSQGHSIPIFRENMSKPIEFTIPKEKITLYQFEIVIIPDKGENMKYIGDNINDPKLQEVFTKIGDKTTIYFQNMLVKDETGTIKFLPVTYGYLVAETKESK